MDQVSNIHGDRLEVVGSELGELHTDVVEAMTGCEDVVDVFNKINAGG